MGEGRRPPQGEGRRPDATAHLRTGSMGHQEESRRRADSPIAGGGQAPAGRHEQAFHYGEKQGQKKIAERNRHQETSHYGAYSVNHLHLFYYIDKNEART